MAMTAWSAKVRDQLDLLVGEGTHLLAVDARLAPISSSFLQQAEREEWFERRSHTGRYCIRVGEIPSCSAVTSTMCDP